jgi:leader peptidase (prepilin peptidase)/N-methyltransferase
MGSSLAINRPGRFLDCDMSAGEIAMNLSIVAGLTAAAWIDARTLRIPNAISLAVFALGLALAFVSPRMTVGGALAGAALAGSLMALSAAVAKRRAGTVALGGGDIKLAGAIGAWIGVFDVSWFLLLAAVIGLVAFGAVRMIGGPALRFRYLPFGPALAVAGVAVWGLQPSRLVEAALSAV